MAHRPAAFARFGIALDVTVGLMLFAVLTVLFIGNPLSGALWTAGDAPSTAALLVLAGVSASLATLNFALLRHLRRVYASPRQGGWGRGETP